jgi:type I toxin-antitoxin system toxin SymE
MTTTKSTARTLTVSSLYRERGKQHRKKECIVPSIRLNGKWLAALGFVLEQKLSVVANGTMITITPLALIAKIAGGEHNRPNE